MHGEENLARRCRVSLRSTRPTSFLGVRVGSSKKYKGKVCVYCRQNISATADHIFPREIFQAEQRIMLPKVPACVSCNNEKSKLELYLLSVLPFGATHPNAHKVLSIDVPKRLNKNRKLREKLKEGFGYKDFLSNNGIEKKLSVEFDAQQLNDFVGFVGRGLMWHHWGIILPLTCTLKVFTPTPAGIVFLNRLFQLQTKYRVEAHLGDGTVRYKGIMSETDEGVSVWAVQLLGGITVSDDKLKHLFSNSFVAILTGPHETLDALKIFKD
jgi:hypothetical protein